MFELTIMVSPVDEISSTDISQGLSPTGVEAPNPCRETAVG
jgi:hypothetical protein